MPAGAPGNEQFRRAIVEFRNLHIVAALGPLFDFRSESRFQRRVRRPRRTR